MAIPIEYWRGGVDEQLKEHGRRIAGGAARTTAIETRVATLERNFWQLKGMLVFASAIGSLLGGSIISFALYLITKGHHHS